MVKISQLFREYILGLSIILTIIGAIIFIFGALGILIPDMLMDSMGFDEALLNWSAYIFGLGIIVLLAGVYYLYEFEKNKRFLMTEINTNKRSEFVKRHIELKKAARHLPSKYQDILAEKEKELKVK
jgi:uncharacterized membrane protein YuzA (DUF378 family)